MSDPRLEALEARLLRLEAAVEELRRAVLRPEAPAPTAAPLPPTQVQAPTVSPAPVYSAPPAAPPAQAGVAERVLDGEFWLSKLGIGLLLFGVAFLFKYSIEQGWITPAVRVLSGAALGAVLTVSGLRLHGSQRNLSRVLVGGGIATFYMVAFAASQLYGLLPEAGALALMTAVTAFAYYLSLREEEALLTIVGTLGGLGTPFLLYPRTGDVTLLAGYIAILTAWNGVVYARRRWEAALGAAALGSWLALVSGLIVSERAAAVVGTERWALQAGVALAWVVFGVLPAALPFGGAREDDDTEFAVAAALTLASPLLALGMTSALWTLTGEEWGWGALGGGALYLGAAAAVRRADARMTPVLAFTAAVLLALGVLFAFAGNPRLLLLVAVAAGLHFLARRGFGDGVGVLGHLLFALLALVFLARGGARTLLLVWDPVETGSAARPFLGADALTDLALVAAALATSFLLEGRARLAYRLAAHAAVLQWSWRELAGARAGEAVVSALWGVYGVALLVAATLRRSATLQWVAKATLLVMLAKMFLVDLRALEALWRVLLFSGLGGLFLLLSYFLGRRRAPGPV